MFVSYIMVTMFLEILENNFVSFPLTLGTKFEITLRLNDHIQMVNYLIQAKS